MFVYLRDARATKFTNYVLSMIDSNLANGSIYFNCYPNNFMNKDHHKQINTDLCSSYP